MQKVLYKNIVYLLITQGANFILPLITLPYITRVVGPENYGLIEFSTAVILYFSAVVIFGFNTTATRRIAAYAKNEKQIASTFSIVFYTRLLLLIGVSVLFCIVLYSVPALEEKRLLLWYAFPMVVGWALYPEYVFQGLQKAGILAFINIVVKALAAVAIFSLIQSKEDYPIVLAINGFAQIGVALFTLFYTLKKLPYLKLRLPASRMVKAYLKQGLYAFVSHFSVRVSTFSSVLILGLYIPERELGYFAAAAKLIIVAQSFMFLPLVGALFPFLSNVYKRDPLEYARQFKKLFLYTVLFGLVATLVLYLLAPFIVQLVFGQDYASAVPLLRILSILLLLTSFSHFYSYQGLMVLKEDRKYLILVLSTGALTAILNFSILPYTGVFAATWIKVVIEVFMVIVGYLLFKKAMKNKITSA
jgi:polysaccharide transporter, PST family